VWQQVARPRGSRWPGIVGGPYLHGCSNVHFWQASARIREKTAPRQQCQLISDTLVSIRGERLRRWLERRKALVDGLVAGHAIGRSLADLAVLLHGYRRAQREVSVHLSRFYCVRVSAFNLNAFSSQRALSLICFLPKQIRDPAMKPQVVVTFTYLRHAVSNVECPCIVLRRLVTPTHWADLDDIFGRSNAALSIIFHATVESIFNHWGHLSIKLRADFMRLRARLYAGKFKHEGAALDGCMCFIHVTAIAVA